jgi:hypothetical protein
VECVQKYGNGSISNNPRQNILKRHEKSANIDINFENLKISILKGWLFIDFKDISHI